LVFLCICIVFSTVLLAARSPSLASTAAPAAPVSREGAFVLQNLLLIGVVAVVLWGTVLPLVSGMLGQQRVVGVSYYERAAGPLFLVLLAVMAAGPLLPWRRAAGAASARALAWPAGVAAVVLIALVVAGVRSIPALVALPLVASVVATCVTQYARLGRGWSRLPGMLVRRRRRYGAYLAHLGLAVLVVGIAASHFWQQDRAVSLAPGQQVTVAGYTLTYAGSEVRQLADHTELVGTMRFGSSTLEPGRATYAGLGGQSLTHVAISTTPLADVYVVLTGIDEAGSASFRIFVNPLVTWIWAGGAIIILGVVLGNVGERATEMAAVRRRVPALAR
jgi:cytochrome c-type biogenesis protein CcmF